MAKKLTKGFEAVALKIQEAEFVHSDVRARLADAVNDAHRGSGDYGYYIDHAGDGESGDCIYSCNGDIRKAPYEIGSQGGKAVANIDMDNSTNVVPRTTYEEEADDDDHYASMTEAFVKSNIYTDLPLYERFISKGERNSADEGDFAGKGKSFPILKPGDVSAAVHAMGRAGSGNYGMAQLKANIIRIAKKKGWTKYLPKSWQGDSTSESVSVPRGTPGTIALFESAQTLETIVLREAKSDYEIKLIAPGAGSSAFYPAEVLKRDGPKVFKEKTHVYLNHPTAAEEAQRPEGDVTNLAGVLTTSAVYHESHPKGPGLYARMKVFADHAQLVEEKAAHVGMSIRASGIAEADRKQGGLPVLKELTHAESVDVVTRAGAGGMILTEALRGANEGESEMTDQQIKELVESAVTKAVAAVTSPVQSLQARALRGDAMVEANKILAPLTLHESAKARVVENVTRDGVIPTKDGAVDVAKFAELVTAEAKREGAYLSQITNGGSVRNLGTSGIADEPQDPQKMKEAEKAHRKAQKRLREASTGVFQTLMGGSGKAAELAATKGQAA